MKNRISKNYLDDRSACSATNTCLIPPPREREAPVTRYGQAPSTPNKASNKSDHELRSIL